MLHGASVRSVHWILTDFLRKLWSLKLRPEGMTAAVQNNACPSFRQLAEVSKTHSELVRKVFQEPRVAPNAVNCDAIGWVTHKYLGNDVHAFSRQVKVRREAILDAHDPLHHITHSIAILNNCTAQVLLILLVISYACISKYGSDLLMVLA